MFECDVGLLAEFVIEANEGLAEIEKDLLTIEASGSDIDVDLVNKVFRAVHSIKGAAGFLALHKAGDLSHSMENVLSLVRTRSLIPTNAVVDQLLKSADLLKRMIADIETSNGVDVSEHAAALKAIASGESPAIAAPATELVGDSATDQAENLAFRISSALIAEHRAEGRQVHRLQFDLLRDSEVRNTQDCIQRLRDTGEIIDSFVDESGATSDKDLDSLPWNILHASVLSAEQLSTFFGIPADRIQHCEAAQPAANETPASAAAANVQPSVPAVPVASGQHQSTDGAARPATQAPVHPPNLDMNIRVSVAVLDRLMNLAGELVLSRNQLILAVGRDDKALLESIAGRIDQVTSELQETIMQTRMQPIGNIFSKFTRVVRDLSQQLGKECSLELEGKDVELDKTIIEAIGDPLTHLVRNSVDHGLETPDVRRARGKNAVGTVRLTAAHQEGKVLLSISDDGAGIDAGRIKRKAVEKGVVTEEAAAVMSDHDAVRLIFAPGLSTAEQVTAVSGRGVGMDVVKTNFERIGGTVEIQTELGKGTTITVRLPLTLAIIPSMIASCNGQRFAMPQVNISELVRVLPKEHEERIGVVNHAEVLRLRGSLLPLIRLNTIVGSTSAEDMPRDTAPAVTNIIVIESGRLRYGLVVDRLHDSEEIVVKPLGRHLKGIKTFSGATVLGDGQIALILDAGGVAARGQLQLSQISDNTRAGGRAQVEHAEETIRTLLFSNHPDERFGVPMSNVLRIERIQTMQIDSVADQQVLQYRGGTLTLLNLEDNIHALRREDNSRLYVIVFRHSGREIGLIAPDILDIRDIPASLDSVSFAEAGVMGSIVLDGYAVRMLELYEFGNRLRTGIHAESHRSPVAHSDWSVADVQGGGAQAPRILYAEDSSFFRSKITHFLEEEGWQVVACRDGQEAWDRLQDSDAAYDLLLTDIEMPRMNGLELTRHARQIERWKELPIIAVTSLATDTERKQGLTAGVTEYHVKIDRDQLLAALSAQLRVPLTR